VKNQLIIVRYGEIALKGKETRRRFEDKLVSNIKKALETEKIIFKTTKERGRIYVFTEEINKSIKVLQKIFGLTSISPAIKTKSDINSMQELATKIAKENKLSKNKSFALRVTRTGSHNYTSQDIAIKIGNDIVKKTNAKVNLTKPNFELFIEIRNNDTYFYTKKTRCIGGMPYNTQGTILGLIDGIESILASWYLIRRGCSVFFLCYDEKLCKTVEDFSKKWYIDSEKKLIKDEENVYDYVKKNHKAIVTGYKIDEIEEIKNMKKPDGLPILHPLIAMNKEEIIKKCKEIGLKT